MDIVLRLSNSSLSASRTRTPRGIIALNSPGYRLEKDEVQSVGGIAGGQADFASNVGLMYYVSFELPRATLDVIALLRYSRRTIRATPASLPTPPPAAIGRGGGTVLGGHAFYFDAERKELWADGKSLISLTDKNVIFIEEAQPPEAAGGLDIVGVEYVDPDLGTVALAPDQMAQWHAHLMPRLRSRLVGTNLARMFIP